MDFPHRFRPARFHSDARARLASARLHFHGDAQRRARSTWPSSVALSVVDGPVGQDSVGRILAESIPGRVDRTRRAIWRSRGKSNPLSWPPDQPPRVNNRASERGFRGRSAYATSRITASSSGGYAGPDIATRALLKRRQTPRSLFPRLCLRARPRFSLFPFFFSHAITTPGPASPRCSGDCAIRTECTPAWEPRGCERWPGMWLEISLSERNALMTTRVFLSAFLDLTHLREFRYRS